MKMLTILFLFLLISPAFGQLTQADIRTIVKEEVRPIIKEEIAASEKRTREYIDLKVDGVERNLNARIDALDLKVDGVEKNLNARIEDVEAPFNPFWIVMIIIVIAIILPQIVIVYSENRQQKQLKTEVQQLYEKIEALIDERLNDVETSSS